MFVNNNSPEYFTDRIHQWMRCWYGRAADVESAKHWGFFLL